MRNYDTNLVLGHMIGDLASKVERQSNRANSIKHYAKALEKAINEGAAELSKAVDESDDVHAAAVEVISTLTRCKRQRPYDWEE